LSDLILIFKITFLMIWAWSSRSPNGEHVHLCLQAMRVTSC